MLARCSQYVARHSNSVLCGCRESQLDILQLTCAAEVQAGMLHYTEGITASTRSYSFSRATSLERFVLELQQHPCHAYASMRYLITLKSFPTLSWINQGIFKLVNYNLSFYLATRGLDA